jgi:hypothetical protein
MDKKISDMLESVGMQKKFTNKEFSLLVCLGNEGLFEMMLEDLEKKLSKEEFENTKKVLTDARIKMEKDKKESKEKIQKFLKEENEIVMKKNIDNHKVTLEEIELLNKELSKL